MLRDRMSHVPFTQLANFTGTPALSVTLHWTADGLPLGVHFDTPFGDEVTLLRLATELEQAQPWFKHLPAIAYTALLAKPGWRISRGGYELKTCRQKCGATYVGVSTRRHMQCIL